MGKQTTRFMCDNCGVKDQAVPEDVACIGEVGLTGEIRSVPRLGARLNELSRRGFRRCLAPAGSAQGTSGAMSLIAVEHVHEAFRFVF